MVSPSTSVLGVVMAQVRSSVVTGESGVTSTTGPVGGWFTSLTVIVMVSLSSSGPSEAIKVTL
ncbi:hypothetical protein ES703_90589 [subsurface metagenome]